MSHQHRHHHVMLSRASAHIVHVYPHVKCFIIVWLVFMMSYDVIGMPLYSSRVPVRMMSHRFRRGQIYSRDGYGRDMHGGDKYI